MLVDESGRMNVMNMTDEFIEIPDAGISLSRNTATDTVRRFYDSVRPVVENAIDLYSSYPLSQFGLDESKREESKPMIPVEAWFS